MTQCKAGHVPGSTILTGPGSTFLLIDLSVCPSVCLSIFSDVRVKFRIGARLQQYSNHLHLKILARP